jgi:serine/threonine protein kinase
VVLILEHYPAGSLARLLRGTTWFTLAWALEVTAETLRALLALHESPHGSTVHRDVNPRNILVRDDSAGQPSLVLADFGLARELGLRGTRPERPRGAGARAAQAGHGAAVGGGAVELLAAGLAPLPERRPGSAHELLERLPGLARRHGDLPIRFAALRGRGLATASDTADPARAVRAEQATRGPARVEGRV